MAETYHAVVRNLRDTSELLYPAVQETLATLGLLPEDSAAKKLAQQYAKVIDSQNGHCRACDDPDCGRSQGSAWAMRWLGPLLLQALEALGATPAARAALAKGKDKTPAAKSQLDKLREARTARRA
jgi:hypothetical protein